MLYPKYKVNQLITKGEKRYGIPKKT